MLSDAFKGNLSNAETLDKFDQSTIEQRGGRITIASMVFCNSGTQELHTDTDGVEERLL